MIRWGDLEERSFMIRKWGLFLLWEKHQTLSDIVAVFGSILVLRNNVHLNVV